MNIQNMGIIALACTIGLSNTVLAASPLNSVQDRRVILGGTFYNTPDSKTTFLNTGYGGLWLKSGTTVRGVEVNANGTATNNGGTMHLRAPGQVVRVDGTINVNALTNGQGTSLGNGGNVFIDSAYLFHNGNIMANGINGGLVQINVGSVTLGSGASIVAKGMGGAGGVVAINAHGPVDLRRGSLIDTSGRVLGSFDSNLINIEGSLVNNDATLRADGISPPMGGSRGGTIRLVASGQTDYEDIKRGLETAAQNSPGDPTAPTLSNSERTFILQRTAALIRNHDGDIALNRDTQSALPSYTSLLSASATGGQIDPQNDNTQNTVLRSGDGGTILLAASRNVLNQGTIWANGTSGQPDSSQGGHGGTISILAQDSIFNSQGRLEANGGGGGSAAGMGGNGGLIAWGYKNAMINSGGMYADGGIGGSATSPGRGGNGGLILFSGNANPTGNGSIDVIARSGGNGNGSLGGKAGTIVSPNPTSLGQAQTYFQQGYLNGQLVSNVATAQTQVNELLTYHENLILLTKNGGSSSVSENLFTRLLQSTIRSVEDPTGMLNQARAEVISKNTGNSPYVYRNLVLGSSRNNLTLDLDHPAHQTDAGAPEELSLPSALSNGQAFTTLNTLTITNNGSVTTPRVSGPYADSPDTLVDLWFVGHNNNNLGGGRLSLLATGNLSNHNFLGTAGRASGGSVHIATTNNYYGNRDLATADGLHGGSIILKAGNDIHQNSGNYFDYSYVSSNGSLMGGTIRMAAKNDFHYYRTEVSNGILANGGLQGGVIHIKAGHDVLMNLPPTPGEPAAITRQRITANGTSPTEGRGGYIYIHAKNAFNINVPQIEATGADSRRSGTVSYRRDN